MRTLMVMGWFVRSAGLPVTAATRQVLQAPPPRDLMKGVLARAFLRGWGCSWGRVGVLVGRLAAGKALHA